MLRLSGIKLPVDADFSRLVEICASLSSVPIHKIMAATLKKRSLDARKKNDIHWVCTIDFVIDGDEKEILSKSRCKNLGSGDDRNFFHEAWVNAKPVIVSSRPVFVVGSGPAGLFCALTLAKAGLKPILLERGENVENRVESVGVFWKSGKLDSRTNVQFGEGGAGTFSDGKLNTGIKDPRCRTVLEQFAKCGAGDEILYEAKPHIGSDRLIGTVKALRREIEQNGGQVLFRHCLSGIETRQGKLHAITITSPDGEQTHACEALVLAPGHSARDTFQMLFESGVRLVPKPFAMGLRVEHPQELINRAQYGENYDRKHLPPADYKLSAHLANGRGVFTFCMCPGGEVVAAASEEGGVCTNGMSLSKRDGENANSALLVGVTPDDFENDHPLAGVELQRKIEKAAFQAAGGGYKAPAQLLGDFLKGVPSKTFGSVTPTYRPGVELVPPEAYLPGFITGALRGGIPLLAGRLRGFDLYDAVLTGPEARSSSPVRILRDETYQSNVRGLFPCGEGAGYAGGIMSAAVDGIKVAEAVIGEISVLSQPSP